MKKQLLLLSCFFLCFADLSIAQTYCPSTWTNTSDDWISNVTFGNINNNSTSTTYTDFTSLSTVVTPGSTEPISVEVSIANGTWLQHCAVWVDWNQNFVFDPSEFTYLGDNQSTAPSFPITGNIQVPVTALSGPTRMRVIEVYFSAPTANDGCLSGTFGETEDYTVIVSSLGPNNIGVVSIDSPTVFCPGSFDVYATIRNDGNNVVTSAVVDWSVDGVQQSTINFTGNLDTAGSNNSTAQVLLGNFNFSTNAGYVVKAWTSLPNGVADTVNINDTTTEVIASNLPAPTNLTASGLLSNQVTISWTGGSSNTWLYQNLPAGSTPAGPGTFLGSPTINLTGLTQNTSYDFYVREVCAAGDTSAWSLITYTTLCNIYGNPYFEDFDGGSWPNGGTTIDQCWSRNPTTGYSWRGNTGTTSSTATGPTGDVNGTGTYVYPEASSGSVGATSTLTTPPIDVGNLNAPQLEFYYHRFGNGMGDFHVIVNGTSTIDTVLTLIGVDANYSATSDPWTFVSIPLTNFANDTVFIDFVSSIGSTGSSFNADMCLDEIRVFQPIPEDFSAIAIDSLSSGCGLSSSETIATRILNIGSGTFNSGFSFPVSADVNGTVTTETITLSGNFGPGDTLPYTFSAAFDLSSFGSYDIKVYPSVQGDSSNTNDTVSTVITNIPVINTFPYYEDFESGNGGWTSGGASNSWALGTPATANINGASSGSNAWNTNLTGQYNNNEESFVLGPCFDFSGLTLPLIKVDVNWNSEFSWDGAQVQASTDAGLTWQPVGAFGDPDNWYNDNSINGLSFSNGEGWTGRVSSGNGSGGWLTAENNLTSFAGNSGVLMRVVFGSDGSVLDEGFAFDNFHILESPDNDIKVDSLYGLQSGCGYTANTPITMRVTNKGVLPQSNIPVFYTVNGTPSPTETIAGPLAPGATFVHNFANTADLSNPQTYTLVGRSALAADEDTTNDASSAKIFASLFTPVVDSVANGETCESGPVTLEVFSTGDTDRWFNVQSGGSALATGSTYTLPNVTQDDTLYVESVQSTTGCNSAAVGGRVPVFAFHSTTPQINFTSQVTGSLTVTFTSSLSSNTDSVLWNFNDGTFATAANPVHTFPQSQSYLVTLTAYAGSCVADTSKAVFVPVGGINDNAYTNLNVFPNPSDGSFRISAENISGEVNIEILSITGNVVYSEKAEAMGDELIHDIRLKDIAQGTYILKIRNDKTLINGRIVID